MIEHDINTCDLCGNEDNLFQFKAHGLVWDERLHICGQCLHSKFVPWLESQKKKSSNANEDN